MNIFIFLGGLVLLVIGANVLVRGASKLAPLVVNIDSNRCRAGLQVLISNSMFPTNFEARRWSYQWEYCDELWHAQRAKENQQVSAHASDELYSLQQPPGLFLPNNVGSGSTEPKT